MKTKKTRGVCPFERAQIKRRKKQKALISACATICALIIFASASAIANSIVLDNWIAEAKNNVPVEYGEGEQLVPIKDEDGYWTFTTDRDFKVMHLTDIHIGGGFMSTRQDQWAQDALETMIRAEKPDLVVVTGDIAFPVPFIAGTFNNLNATKIFANLMESLGVYWTFTFGNHDTEIYSYFSREDICNYYEERLENDFKYCLFERGFSGEDMGYGNTIIKVKNSTGIVTNAFVLMDTHSYVDGDIFGLTWKYDNLHKSQVDWYKNEIQSIVSANIQIDPSATELSNHTFIHIPIEEYRDGWKEYVQNNNQDTENTRFLYGKVGENPNKRKDIDSYGVYCGWYTNDFFETGLENGLKTVFCGHDHLNNFSILYNGGSGDKYIQLTYGMGMDYLAYVKVDDHVQRGCTLLTVSSNGTYAVTAKNYYTDYNGKDVGA